MRSLFDRIKRGAASLIIGAGLIGLSGCATVGAVESRLDYDRFYDTNGEYRLVGRNNDVWIEKIDGTEKRQITHTPKVQESIAFFAYDNKYIACSEYGWGASKMFIVPINKDDNESKEIPQSEFESLYFSRENNSE